MRTQVSSFRLPAAMVAVGLTIAMMVAGCGAQKRVGSASAGGAGVADRAATEARVLDYFHKMAALPPGATVAVTDWSAGSLPGWSKAALQVTAGGRSQKADVTVSNDGHYMIRGEVVDLTADPLKAIRDKIDLKGQPFRGAADAPVVIVEYSDFQCPFCSRASQIVQHEVFDAYPGKIKLVHKNFPLTTIHPWAQNAAIAAECAFAQSNDGYWKLYEALFQQQKSITPVNLKEKLLAAAAAAGLNRQQFEQCYDGQATASQVQADVAEGNAVGVNSTPMFFINGHRLAGAQPAEAFRTVVDQELGPH